jgi:dienelactone hydrolase
VHLPGFKTDTIKQGVFKVGNITLHGAQLAFITKINTQDENENILWYYRTGMQSAVVKVDDAALSKLPGERLTDDLLAFSKDGNSIIFSLKPSDILADARKMVTSNGLVDVWNYKDQYLQAQQIKERDYLANKYFTAVVAVNSGRVIQVNQKGDDWDIKFANNGNEAYALVGSNKNRWETYWRTSERVTGYLISLKDGSRRIICDHLLDAQNPAVFSAKGKYVIWYDREKKTYFTYNLSTGMAKNITANFSVPLYDDEDDHPHPPYDFGIAAWLENDTAVLIYDRYDIWKVDPDGKKKPVNITMGYGQKNKVVLRYLNLNERNAAGASTIKGDTILLLTAFNRVNKYNGFYSLNLDQKKAPEELSMGPYIYHLPQLSISSFLFFPWVPIKVESTKRYVVRRMSATEFPNLFVTSDFREFTQLTNIQPQKAYNWMTSELVSWKMPDGKMTTGILYKPEDFNPQKKYPVIFYVYEQLTDGINAFIKPEMSPGPINIPSYVSNDYIIFIPDIHYKIGYPGESAYNTVVSAANHLAKNSWVDKKRMGIQGHSFGGYEVNYIVTRTNLFAAAMSGAGPADLVSMYGSLREGAVSSQLLFENFQFRIGATLWAKPDLFIKNSPVFYSNKVSTPLLIMHNKEDDIVSWTQGIEFFTALRRQNKRVWMLQYDGYGHSVEGKAAEDYSLRMTQFFNHYLKGTPAPEWMVKGIPATKKGIENGFEMDSLNANP